MHDRRKRRRLDHRHALEKRIVVLPPEVRQSPAPIAAPQPAVAPPPPVVAPQPVANEPEPVLPQPIASPEPAPSPPRPIEVQPVSSPPPPPPPPPAQTPSPTPAVDPVVTTREETPSSSSPLFLATSSSAAITCSPPLSASGSRLSSVPSSVGSASASSSRPLGSLSSRNASPESAMASEGGTGNKAGAVAGGVIGGIAVLVLSLILGLCLLRRTLRRRREKKMSGINRIWDENGDRQPTTLQRSPSDASYLPVRRSQVLSSASFGLSVQYQAPQSGATQPHNSMATGASDSPEATEDGPWEDINVNGAAAAAAGQPRMGVPSSEDSDSQGVPRSRDATLKSTITPKRVSPIPSATASMMRRKVGESSVEGPAFRPPITEAESSGGRETPTLYQLPPLPSAGGPLWALPPRSAPKPATSAALAGLGSVTAIQRGTGGFFKVNNRASQEPSPPPVPQGQLFPPARDSAYTSFLKTVPHTTKPLNVPGAPPPPPHSAPSPSQAYGGMTASPISPSPAITRPPANARQFITSLSAPPVPPLPSARTIDRRYPRSEAETLATTTGGQATMGQLSVGSEPKPLAPQPWRTTQQTGTSSWAGDRGR